MAIAASPWRMDTRRTVAVSFALSGHIVLVGVLVISGAWGIDKLAAAEPPPILVAIPGASAPIPAGGEETSPPTQEKKRPRRRARDQTQPAAEAATSTDTNDTKWDGGGPNSGAPGTGGGDGGSGAVPSVTCLAPPCRPLIEDVGVLGPPPKRTVVPARLIEGRRIAGDPQIRPPESVRARMNRVGQEEVRATIEMCLDAAGRVSGLRVLMSTGHVDYDDRLLAQMRGWRYRPYRIADGDAVPVCTAVTFIYRSR